jgi:hypothetical protein
VSVEGSARPRRLLAGVQSWSAALAVCGMLAAQADAAIGFQSAEAKSAIAACDTQRAPLVARQKEYEELKRARMGQAMMASAKAGAGLLISGAMFGMTGGLSTVLRPGGIGGTSTPAAGGGAQGSGDGGTMISQILSMNIPGVGHQAAGAGSADAGTNAGGNYNRVLLAVCLITAMAGAVDAYMKVKQTQLDNDARRIAISIDGDAASQMSVAAELTTQIGGLADCRQKQVADFRAQLSGASNDKDRKRLDRSKSGLQAALNADLGLSSELVDQQAKLEKTFIQGRAMAEGKSEADILGDQPPAYGGVASVVKLSMPAPPTTATVAPSPPPPLLFRTTRATVVRAGPNPRAVVTLRLPPGHTLTPRGRAPEDPAWWQVDIGGTPGFIRVADLAEANATTGTGKAKAPAVPQLAPPNNIRSLNRQVLLAKTKGVDRLKTLSTEVQSGRLEPGRGQDRREAQAVAQAWWSRGRAA